MSQQAHKAYILRGQDGTYVVVSNGGQAVRLNSYETIDDVARYIIKSQRVPVRDLPPQFAGGYNWKPISDFDFTVLSTLITEAEAIEANEMVRDEGEGFLSNIGSKIPALLSILHIK